MWTKEKHEEYRRKNFTRNKNIARLYNGRSRQNPGCAGCAARLWFGGYGFIIRGNEVYQSKRGEGCQSHELSLARQSNAKGVGRNFIFHPPG